uniref:Putative ovule protein n=1 Tax=Solanum chacoense TaxID=4108 RepID=A0A0V0H3H6_SOLCH
MALNILAFCTQVVLIALRNNLTYLREMEGILRTIQRRYTSLPRERVYVSIDEETDQHDDFERHVETVVAHKRLLSQRGTDEVNKADSSNENEGHSQNELSPTSNTARCLIRSASISFSKCVGAVWDDCEDTTYKRYANGISRSSKEPATLYA